MPGEKVAGRLSVGRLSSVVQATALPGPVMSMPASLAQMVSPQSLSAVQLRSSVRAIIAISMEGHSVGIGQFNGVGERSCSKISRRGEARQSHVCYTHTDARVSHESQIQFDFRERKLIDSGGMHGAECSRVYRQQPALHLTFRPGSCRNGSSRPGCVASRSLSRLGSAHQSRS
jgi:hypothetical protein